MTTSFLENGRAPSSYRRRKRGTFMRTEIVEVARRTRADLVRVIDLAQRRRREEASTEDGVEVLRLVKMTDGERVEALQQSLVWLQKAENDMRHLRVLIERQLAKEAF